MAHQAYSSIFTSSYGSKFGTISRHISSSTSENPITPTSDYSNRLGSVGSSLKMSMEIPLTELELALHYSPSFTEMFEQEWNKSNESLSNSTTAKSGGNTEGDEQSRTSRGTHDTVRSHVQDYQVLPTSSNKWEGSSTNNPLPTTNITLKSIGRGEISDSLTKHIQQHSAFSPCNSPSEVTIVHTSSPALISIIPYPKNSGIQISKIFNLSTSTTIRHLTPSVSRMNAMNEKDPAFIRTMEALRMQRRTPICHGIERSHSIKLPRPSTTEHADRSFSGMSSRSLSGAKKRCTSFLNKLRGYGGS
jgi:hypothetical protein